jgi:hypothetical protein
MIAFKKTIQVGACSFDFSFDPVACPYGIKYSVKVKADQQIVECFDLKNFDGNWKPIPPYPGWLQSNADSLSELINLTRAQSAYKANRH